MEKFINEYYEELRKKHGVDTNEEAEAIELRGLITELIADIHSIKRHLGKKKLFYLRKPIEYKDLGNRIKHQYGKDIYYNGEILSYREFYKVLIKYRYTLYHTCVKKGYPFYTVLYEECE